MHQQKSKKILIYFFLLIILGSTNNLNFSELNIFKIDNIKISGLNSQENDSLVKKLHKLDLENILFLNQKKITKILDKNTFIENYNIRKKYPSTLHVEIQKTKFLAKLNYNGKTYLIGNNGRLSISSYSNKDLPFIFGKPNINDFLKFKEIIDLSNFSYDQVVNLYFFPSERWDIMLQNDILIKLPKDHVKSALDIVFEMLNDQNFKDIKIFDVRVINQIILNERRI